MCLEEFLGRLFLHCDDDDDDDDDDDKSQGQRSDEEMDGLSKRTFCVTK